MKDETILKKAYDKAVKNGWDKRSYIVAVEYLLEKGLSSHVYRIFIFEHAFAKAFWGEDNHSETTSICSKCRKTYTKISITDTWKHNLQRLVLEEEPLQYLKQFLDDN